MTGPTLPPAEDHDGYIAAVVRALEADGVTVIDWRAETDEVREALIELDDTEALAWTECEGWSHLTGGAPGQHYANCGFLAIGIVPTPNEVAEAYARVTAPDGWRHTIITAFSYRDPAHADTDDDAARVAAELAKY